MPVILKSGRAERGTSTLLFHDDIAVHRIKSMHEVVPKVVAIAVRMVMANWMIFCQSSFLFMFVMFLISDSLTIYMSF